AAGGERQTIKLTWLVSPRLVGQDWNPAPRGRGETTNGVPLEPRMEIALRRRRGRRPPGGRAGPALLRGGARGRMEERPEPRHRRRPRGRGAAAQHPAGQVPRRRLPR